MVTTGWVEFLMYSLSNSAISEAWITGLPAESSDALSTVVSVAGQFTGTGFGKRAAILRVWEAPPEGFPRVWLELDGSL